MGTLILLRHSPLLLHHVSGEDSDLHHLITPVVSLTVLVGSLRHIFLVVASLIAWLLLLWRLLLRSWLLLLDSIVSSSSLNKQRGVLSSRFYSVNILDKNTYN